MNFPDGLLPPLWIRASWLMFAPILLAALLKAPWRQLGSEARLHQLLGACVMLIAFWSISSGIKPGLNFHLLGATALTLMFGPRLSLFGLTLVLAAMTLAGKSGLFSLAANGLSMILVPVLVSHAIYRVADSKLPNHIFVYIFVNGFFGGALAMAASGAASTLLLGMSGAYSWPYLLANYLPYYILLGWSEALLTGMALTLMVVFRPEWVGTFDDARYLRHK